tara:strand:- start:2892 stop:4223 length:1332 start_codon:yes stop_codon:yes gene_type:complete
MSQRPTVYSVSQINRHVRSILEHEVGPVFIEGEISNLSKPSSGHYYFTLKDANAQIRCAYFKNRHQHSVSSLEVGQQIIAGGILSLYEQRGEYQLIVEQVKEAGLGNLFQQFETLKKKLLAQGLFAPEKKRQIPKVSNAIGIISSPTGAAIQDILTTLKRRFPLSEVMIYPSEVQGKNAHLQIIKALDKANLDRTCQVLILARGGGSIEDLWAFNQESLAYAIAESDVPIVSGIGHETDFTIADFVADLRAATPTAAAEAVTPNQEDIEQKIKNLKYQLDVAINHFINQCKVRLKHQRERILSPEKYIQNLWQRLDFLSMSLDNLLQRDVTKLKQQFHFIKSKLVYQSPAKLISHHHKEQQYLKTALQQSIERLLENKKQKLNKLISTLNAVGPDRTLARGYAIVTRNKKIIRKIDEVDVGDEITIQLATGKLISSIKEKEKD